MNSKKNYSGTLNVQIHSADSAFVFEFLFDLGFHVITELVAGASSFGFICIYVTYPKFMEMDTFRSMYIVI